VLDSTDTSLYQFVKKNNLHDWMINGHSKMETASFQHTRGALIILRLIGSHQPDNMGLHE